MKMFLTMVLVSTLGAGSALAQMPASCAPTPQRADGLRLVRAQLSLADLAMTIAAEPRLLTAARIERLDGPCANDVHACRMGLISFNDGAVFEWHVQDDRFVPSPRASGRDFGAPLRLGGAPIIPGAGFITATHVDGGRDRELEVGLWKNDAGYVVAAFTHNETGYSAPVELIRSAQPLESVTYFPAPDTSAGTLGLLARTSSGIILVSLNWHHDALTKSLR